MVMGYIEVTGGVKHQREIAEQTVVAMMRKLLPRIRQIQIEVKIKKNLEKVHGGMAFCLEVEPRKFEIEVEKDLGLRDFVTAICHEMVHVKQGVRGELTNKLGFQYWKGRKCEKDYWEQPWEKEAYRLQDKLGQYVWENIL